MGFLQLWILWALPLAALPVVIHLVNRMRHRTVEWAAMRFLQKVTRASTSMAKVRQWLILALRVLVCLALIAAFARPLFGGFMGLRFSGAPDTVVILLDRSASMRAQGAGGAGESLLDAAVRGVSSSAAVYGGGPRLVLLDSAGGKPAQLPSAAVLADLPAASATDAGASIPAMLSSALDYLAANPAGQAEIWIASDLQASSWQMGDPAWALLESRIKSMPTPPRVKLLAVSGRADAKNAALTLLSVRSTEVPGSDGRKWRHEVSFAVNRTGDEGAEGDITLTLGDGANRVPVKVQATGPFGRHRHVFETEALAAPRAAWLELPADANAGDNRVWFVLGKPVPGKVVVVGDPSDRATRLCALAAKGEVVSPAVLRAGDLRDAALVVWNAPEPSADIRKEVDGVTAAGGTLLLLPRAKAAWGETVSFGDLVDADAKSPLHVTHWEHAEGPFADSDSGTPLSLDKVEVLRRAPILAKTKGADLALFADGSPMALRLPAGRGSVVALATSPDPSWSSLRLGGVFIPLMRRLQADGASRFAPCRYAEAGSAAGAAPGEPVAVADPAEAGAPAGDAPRAGVFRSDAGLLCLNRPAAEDELLALPAEAASTALKGVPIRSFAAKGGDDDGAMQTEIWRAFLVLMLVLLAAEAFLLVPRADAKADSKHDTKNASQGGRK